MVRGGGEAWEAQRCTLLLHQLDVSTKLYMVRFINHDTQVTTSNGLSGTDSASYQDRQVKGPSRFMRVRLRCSRPEWRI